MNGIQHDEAYESVQIKDNGYEEIHDLLEHLRVQDPYHHTPLSSCDSGFADELPSETESIQNIHSCDYSTDQDLNQNNFAERERISSLFFADEDGDNLLHISIVNKDEISTFQIIQTAPDFTYLTIKNNLGQTALHLAVLTRQPKVVRRLICAGAVVDAQDRYGNSPLHLASALGYSDIVRHLVKPVQYEETLINPYRILFQCIPQNLSVRNYGGFTCLHLAIVNKCANVIPLLLDAGADINFGHCKSGRSALHLASELGNMEILLLLLAGDGVNLNALDFGGLTPFQLAHGRQNESVERLFLQQRIPLTPMDFDTDEDSDSN